MSSFFLNCTRPLSSADCELIALLSNPDVAINAKAVQTGSDRGGLVSWAIVAAETFERRGRLWSEAKYFNDHSLSLLSPA